jgi:hypothetical protein
VVAPVAEEFFAVHNEAVGVDAGPADELLILLLIRTHTIGSLLQSDRTFINKGEADMIAAINFFSQDIAVERK